MKYKTPEEKAKERRLKQKELNDFNYAMAGNTLEGLKHFLQLYPNSNHKSEIRKAIQVLMEEQGNEPESQSDPPIKSYTEDIPEPEDIITNVDSLTAAEMEERISRLKEVDSTLVFMFGNPGSSKTTVLAALNSVFDSEYIAIPNMDMDPKLVKNRNEVIKITNALEMKKFPPVTSLEMVFEYDVAVRKPNMKEFAYFSFLEMSGERQRTLLTELTRDMREYLAADLDRIFLLIIGMDEVKSLQSRHTRQLLKGFLGYLRQYQVDTSKVALVISKYDRDNNHADLEEIMNSDLKGIKKFLANEIDGNAKVFPFSVGKVEKRDKNGELIDTIVELDLRDCVPIIEWILSVSSRYYRPDDLNKYSKGGFINKLIGFFKSR